MKLLDEIIDMLADDQRPVTGALLKTKVLLHQLGAPELATWVNDELSGYPDNDRVPRYRVIPGRVIGNISNPARRYSNHPIPIGHLDESEQKTLQNVPMPNPIATIENLAQSDGSLSRPLPMELNGLLGAQLGNGYHVESARIEIDKASVIGVVSQVRSRLLDFLLELRGKIGPEVSERQVAEAAKNLNLREMFNGAVFGDHTTLVVGTDNVQTVVAHVERGDEGGLLAELKKLGLGDAEMGSLATAIAADRKAGQLAPFEGQTGAWYIELLRKAGKGLLSVGTDVVTGVVSKLLGQYLGAPN